MIAGEQKLLPGFLEGSLTGGAFFAYFLPTFPFYNMSDKGEGGKLHGVRNCG